MFTDEACTSDNKDQQKVWLHWQEVTSCDHGEKSNVYSQANKQAVEYVMMVCEEMYNNRWWFVR